MVTVSTSGKTETDTRVAGLIVSSMARDRISSPTETSIQATTHSEKLTEKESTNGKTEVFIKVSLKKA